MFEFFSQLTTKELIVGIGFLSIIINAFVLWGLKNKELNHNVTQEKLKQLYSKEIEVYEELYALTLEYDRQEYYIGREKYFIEKNSEEDFNLYTEAIEKVFKKLEKNIFYISEVLENKYQKIYKSYLVCFVGVENLSHSDWENKYDDHTDYQIELETLLDKAQKKFYEENKKEIDELLRRIKKEFIKKRNYK